MACPAPDAPKTATLPKYRKFPTIKIKRSSIKQNMIKKNNNTY